eukprot:m.70797 g.70797  ORF g.70797 m.70797 type:complete len:263 (+) comp12165_c0_seq4:338-1126(+)
MQAHIEKFLEVEKCEDHSFPKQDGSKIPEWKVILKDKENCLPSPELVECLETHYKDVMFAVQSNKPLSCERHGGKNLNTNTLVYNMNPWLETKLNSTGNRGCGLVVLQKWGKEYYVILVKKEDKFENEDGSKKYKFNTPGGHVENGETYKEAAIREFEEETDCHLPDNAESSLKYFDESEGSKEYIGCSVPIFNKEFAFVKDMGYCRPEMYNWEPRDKGEGILRIHLVKVHDLWNDQWNDPKKYPMNKGKRKLIYKFVQKLR